MFDNIAGRYDFLNHALSLNIDRSWRKKLLQRVSPALQKQNALVLDLCCGTGDVLLDLEAYQHVPIIGSDFSHLMLTAAQKKILERKFHSKLFESDALQLPLRDHAVDLITIAFGFRNLANYETGLQELHRVLKPGAMLAILEFSHSQNVLMRPLYSFYSRHILPVVGGMISGSREAYTYLPESIEKFPTAEMLRGMMSDAGFERTEYELFTGGIAALHLGYKV